MDAKSRLGNAQRLLAKHWPLLLRALDASLSFSFAIGIALSLFYQNSALGAAKYTSEESKLLVIAALAAVWRIENSLMALSLFKENVKHSLASTLLLLFGFNLIAWEGPLSLRSGSDGPVFRLAHAFVLFLFRGNLLTFIALCLRTLVQRRETADFYAQMAERGLSLGQLGKLSRKVWLELPRALKDRSLPNSVRESDLEWRALSEEHKASEAQELLSRASIETEVSVCLICTRQFEQGESMMIVPMCGHKAHSKCSRLWFQTSAACPECQLDIKNYLLLNDPF